MSDPEAPPPEQPQPLIARLLALIALLALLGSALWASWAILTDRADFSALAPRAGADRSAPASAP